MELSDEDACKIAEPMMDDAMAGVARREYQLHSRHFSVNLKSQVGPDDFLAACDAREADWGSPGMRHLVCIFRKPKSFTLVWNQEYDREAGQVVLIATIALKGGRYFIDQFQLL